MENREKLNIIDRLLLYYFIFQIFFMRWYNGNSYITYMSVVLTMRILYLTRNRIKVKFMDIFWSLSYIGIIIINVLVNGQQPLLKNNGFGQGAANLSVIIYITVLAEQNREAVKKFIMKDIFIVFNIYFLINAVIIYKQFDYTYFMMRGIENNPMYEDHITGLIGQSGTHQLTFYWIVLTLTNLYKYIKEEKRYMFGIVIGEVAFMILASSRNDNTAFFVIFPMFLIQFIVLNLLKRQNDMLKLAKTVMKFLIICSIVFAGISYLYTVNEYINEFVNTRVLEKLEQFSVANKGNRQTNTSEDEERIALFKVALEDGEGYKLGHGIGSIESYGDVLMPAHFGMSEISLRTYEGGIIYLAILILVFAHFLNRVVNLKSKFESNIAFLVISGNMTFMTIYTTIFREPFYSLALSFIFFICAERYNDIKEENSLYASFSSSTNI